MHLLKIGRRISTLLFFSALFLACEQNKDFTVADIPDPKKSGGGYVSNPDAILSASAVEQINSSLSALDQSGKAQVGVVVLNTIGEQVPKAFAVELFNYWGIGQRGVDNGLLILVVQDQHRVEFETGYGLEGELTDLICYRIQQDYIVPYAKINDFDRALMEGVNAVVRQLNNSPAPPQDIVADDSLTLTADTTTVVPAPVYDDYSFQEQDSGFSVSDGLEAIVNSFFSFIFFTILSLAFTGLDLPKKEKQADATTLFRNDYYNSFAFSFLFILLGAMVFFEWMSFLFKQTDLPFYATLIAFYLSWCLFVHVYYLVILPLRTSSVAALADHHAQHEQLAQAYKYLKRFSWVFPVPFLALASYLHQRKLAKLRNRIPQCDCGKEMQRLNEMDDDRFLNRPQIVEEQMRSVDYDVWVCASCNKDRVLRYEDYTSGILKCEKCSAKTLKKTGNEVVSEATYSSSGYGYRIYDCQHCHHQSRIKYTIPKKTKSGSSSGGSSSGSSSWGGGSSGGGGAGSSW